MRGYCCLLVASGLFVGFVSRSAAAPPPNDHFENAADLGSVAPVSVSESNVEATVQKAAGEPGTENNSSFASTLWWKWTAAEDGSLTGEH